MNSRPHAERNRLFAGLPEEERGLLGDALVVEHLEIKQVLMDVDVPIANVYFPEDCLVSVLGVMADGSAVETATIGNEGLVGLPVFLGTDRTTTQAFVQVSGLARRLPANHFLALLPRLPVLARRLNRYTQALFTMVAQSSACNRVHTMSQRCARWLLHTQDRVGREDFPLTQQFLAQMLGVRRATVNEAMRRLQNRGAISYDAGRIRVLDRSMLENDACECYDIIVHEFDRLLGSAHEPTQPPPLAGLTTSADGRTTLHEPEDPEIGE